MSLLQTLINRVSTLTNMVNSIGANAKRTEDFPVMEVLNQEAFIRTSDEGESKKLAISKIVQAARNGLAGIPQWHPGEYTSYSAVIYNNVLYVLSNIASLPFNSSNFAAEVEAGQWVLPFPTSVNLVESPNTTVFDLGDVTALLTGNDFVAYINANGDLYDATDTDKTYFFRFVNNGIDYLYSYDSAAGGFVVFGDGSGNTMLLSYLNLFYNASLGNVNQPQDNKPKVITFDLADIGVESFDDVTNELVAAYIADLELHIAGDEIYFFELVESSSSVQAFEMALTQLPDDGPILAILKITQDDLGPFALDLEESFITANGETDIFFPSISDDGYVMCGSYGLPNTIPAIVDDVKLVFTDGSNSKTFRLSESQTFSLEEIMSTSIREVNFNIE